MAQNLVELCTILIENHLGDLAAQIFTTLAEHGRLSAPTLAAHANIPLVRTYTGLATLLEEQLVLHHAAEEDAPTYYSVSWRNAYNLVRHINVVSLVTERHGEAAGQVVKNILQLGHARVGDLTDAYNLAPGSKRDSGVETGANHVPEAVMVNGAAKSQATSNQRVTSASELHSILRTLLRFGILVKVGTRTLMPIADLQEQLQEAVIVDQFPDRKVTGPKKAKEFALAVNDLKRKWRRDDAFSDNSDASSRGAIKRPGEHFNPNKRLKLNGNKPNGHMVNVDCEPSVSKLPLDLIVRVDFTRCSLGLRSQRLQKLAKRPLGSATGAVYGALLQALEDKVYSVRGESDESAKDDDAEKVLPSADLSQIAEMLDPTIDLGSSIRGVGTSKRLPNGTGTDGKRKHVIDNEFAEIGIKPEISGSEDDEPTTNGFSSYRNHAKRVKMIEAHLVLLQEHSKEFCKRARAGSTSTEWGVDFETLTDGLIQAELDTTIAARFGSTHLRVVRLLRERGKLEEKQVASFAMTRIKDIRAVLTELQSESLAEAQELPKDNQRQPSRTTYLWYFDPQRAQSLILQQTYKAMARTLQRIPVERERFRTIIEKAERTDIKGQEQEKLETHERQLLREWREIEERLLTQVSRMDEVVVILRDCSGRDVSLAT
ncbi:RNA polymerase III subunit C82 [Friedmanniomyces endolithicus]|nr:RNA polymerase III subunit C82 [Friedmanniomyces endolithicus]KAK0795225.1 RNA polymerase III subunit C82 [Friedmanniomyces endolithicus]KAK0798181.1 RNA polymerase III subunit C82 [Friedmanniomyces endolithicus]KAK0805406.1 RNA polymerase III subunit C82 [Friedmanniomyces endolithicus]KAK0844536.1 RNA polymerase III subunit C82 [Friedmanniomyces endolithicus]